MTAVPRMVSSGCTSVGSYPSGSNADDVVSDGFPAGLRVLVVDDDPTCLTILEQLLRRFLYIVTTCSQATVALNILRERKGCFDIVLCDVHMPDMDGFKLLEHVGLEMDLPVIMMSCDSRTSAVMKGIRHGACDYLIKPIRAHELQNIWQHVIRKKWNENKEHEHSGSLEENDRHKKANDDIDYTSGNDAVEGALKNHKKRSNAKEEEDGDQENDDPSASKKPRVVWSVELHQQFVTAVNQLGVDKAVPKRILELMNVPGLTRENVASHLQKFRLYLKRLNGVTQQGVGISNSFPAALDTSMKLASLGRFDMQALAASGQIAPQTLAALHAEILGRSNGSIVTGIDQPSVLQPSTQASAKGIHADAGLGIGQSLPKCQSNVPKHFLQDMGSMEEAGSGFIPSPWLSNTLNATRTSNNSLGLVGSHGGNILIDLLQQHQQWQPPFPPHSSMPELKCPINVQPSCVVVPSQSSVCYQTGSCYTSVTQNSSFGQSAIVDYHDLSPQSNTSSLNVGHAMDGDLKSSSVASRCEGKVSAHSCGNDVLDQGPLRNLGFVGKGTCIPSRFAVDEFESSMNNLIHQTNYSDNSEKKVKVDLDMQFINDVRLDLQFSQQFNPTNDLASVFSD